MEDYSTAIHNIKLNYGRFLFNDIYNSNGSINEKKEDVLKNISILEANLKDKETSDLVSKVRTYISNPKSINKTELLTQIKNYIN